MTNELIYVFTRDYMSLKKCQELSNLLNSLKSESSEDFVVNDYIDDLDIDNVNWRQLIGLEGDEEVHSRVTDLDPFL